MAIYKDLNADPTTQKPCLEDEEAVIQALTNLLNTSTNSRLFNREVSCDLSFLLFEPMSEGAAFAIYTQIMDSVSRWEPRVTFIRSECYVEQDPDNHFYHVHLVFQILGLAGQKFEFTGEIPGAGGVASHGTPNLEGYTGEERKEKILGYTTTTTTTTSTSTTTTTTTHTTTTTLTPPPTTTTSTITTTSTTESTTTTTSSTHTTTTTTASTTTSSTATTTTTASDTTTTTTSATHTTTTTTTGTTTTTTTGSTSTTIPVGDYGMRWAGGEPSMAYLPGDGWVDGEPVATK